MAYLRRAIRGFSVCLYSIVKDQVPRRLEPRLRLYVGARAPTPSALVSKFAHCSRQIASPFDQLLRFVQWRDSAPTDFDVPQNGLCRYVVI